MLKQWQQQPKDKDSSQFPASSSTPKSFRSSHLQGLLQQKQGRNSNKAQNQLEKLD